MAVLTRAVAAMAMVVVVLAACGIPGGEGGGSSHLPTSGGGPYEKPAGDSTTPAEEPYVIVDATADLTDPSVLPSSDGGFDIWFTRDAKEIWYAHLPTIHDLPDVGPIVTFAADEAWEDGRVRAPSVLDDGGDRRVMYYQGADDRIGRARSED